MSFSVQHTGVDLEWSGTDLNGVFAQRRNLLRPAFLGMLADLLRFNRLCTRLAVAGEEAALRQPIGDFLRQHRFGDAFRDWYFLPMIGCIWSCPTAQMLRFPIATMIRFCHNHGLLQIADRPRWYSVVGGSRNYVQRIVVGLDDARLRTPVRQVRRMAPDGPAHGRGGAVVATDDGVEHFDEVVFACHSDQALALLADARGDERAVLGAIGYHRNRAVLHTDASMLPRRQRAWAAWNYERGPDAARETGAVCLHYLINRLQPLPFEVPVIVSLNPLREPAAERVIGDFDYAHPVFDQPAIDAQARSAGAAGAAVDLVLRCLDALRISRGRPGIRAGGGRGAATARRRSTGARSRMTGRTVAPVPTGGSQPLLGIGRVRHHRLRPVPNRFDYPTYFLLLPMRSLAAAAHPALARNRFGLISFHDRDHGDGRGDALAWVDELLLREGIGGADGEIWLHCYPRVLGLTFKPVSFWYCHRADGALEAIVVEVNNTFGERHCYLLGPQQGVGWGREVQARKVFHVSPFCEVGGDYRFRFMRTDVRPGASDGAARTVACIDHHDADGLLLRTSVSGELAPLTARRIRRHSSRVPLMTAGVIARIHWQALKLWLKRVPVHRKPAPPAQFISR